MSIGKPKNDPIDLNGLMNEIENDHRITVESDAIDKHIEELRAAQKDLRQATETLEKATMTLNGAIAALKSATDNSTNIVICAYIIGMCVIENPDSSAVCDNDSARQHQSVNHQPCCQSQQSAFLHYSIRKQQ